MTPELLALLDLLQALGVCGEVRGSGLVLRRIGAPDLQLGPHRAQEGVNSIMGEVDLSVLVQQHQVVDQRVAALVKDYKKLTLIEKCPSNIKIIVSA